MFSSQKNSTRSEQNITPIGAASLNTSYIIIVGLLPQVAAYRWAVAALTGAVS